MTDYSKKPTGAKETVRAVSGRERRNWTPVVLGLGAVAIGVFVLRGLNEDKPAEQTGARAKRGTPVTTVVAGQKIVPVEIRGIGSVEAYKTVAIKPQVDGQLTRVAFTQGQSVKQGDLLFTIDARSLQAGLAQVQATVAKDRALFKQAQAAVVRDRAQARTARVQTGRYRELQTQGAVSQEQFDQVRTNADALDATVRASEAIVENAAAAVRADQAAVESARVQLGYATIRAPINGRTGSLATYAGNLVRSTDTQPLVVINRVSPVYVTFSVPEQELPAIKRFQARGRLPVRATAPKDTGPPAVGYLSFIDNAVDNTTGTIRLKATFNNRDNYLVPGQFVNTTVTLSTGSRVVVVPEQAVQTGQQGQYVFVVKGGQTAELRPVTTERSFRGEAVISKGLAVGETVVSDGQLQLVPGTKVQIKNGKQERP